MTERRHPTIKLGRRKTDIPVVALEQFKNEMKEHVAKTIEQVVNGKIRNIDTKLTNYIASDMEWKKTNEPALENMKNLNTGWKVVLSFFGSIAVIAGGIIGIKKLFNL